MTVRKLLGPNLAMVALLLAVSSAAILYRLGARSLQDSDEAIYAEVAKQMVRSGDWLTPHYNLQPYFDKPPLTMWITAALFSIFGVSTVSALSTSAFAGILLVLVTYLSGRKAFGTAVGLLGSVILLANYEYIWRAQTGRMDVPLTLFIYLIVLAFQYARADRRYWYAIGFFFGLAFMTKSWAALVIWPVLLLTLIIDGTARQTLRSSPFWGGMGLAFMVLIPWNAAMLALHPEPFIYRSFTYGVVSRSITNLDVNLTTPLYYVYQVLFRFATWSVMAPFALAGGLYYLLRKERRASEPIYLVLVLLVFTVYTLAQTRFEWYVFPIYPALSILIARMIVRAFRSHRDVAFIGLVLSLSLSLLSASWRAIGFLLLMPAAIGAALVGLSWIAERYVPRRTSELREQAARAGRAWGVQLLRLWEAFRVMPRSTLGFRAFVVVVTLFFAGRSISNARIAYHRTFTPLAKLSETAGRLHPHASVLALHMSNDYHPDVDVRAVVFYSDRPVVTIESRDELAGYMTSGQSRDVILHASFMTALSDDYRFEILAEEPPFVYARIDEIPQGGP